VVVEGRYLAQAQPGGVVAALGGLGFTADILDPEKVPMGGGWLARYDLLLARGRSPALLGALARAEVAGVPTINRSRAIAAVLDKGRMAAALTAAGLPTPETRAGRLADLAEGALYPVVVKPILGDNGRGVRIARSRSELLDGAGADEVLVAQSLVEGERRDTKLYVAGRRVWAVKKVSPLHDPGSGAPAERVPLTSALEALALRCAALFGLDLAGVDCVETACGHVVIEVNDFPNYSGLPEASEEIARLALSRARLRASAAPSEERAP
jgi:ribosomal protein S6--L-glutamate ligase